MEPRDYLLEASRYIEDGSRMENGNAMDRREHARVMLALAQAIVAAIESR